MRCSRGARGRTLPTVRAGGDVERDKLEGECRFLPWEVRDLADGDLLPGGQLVHRGGRCRQCLHRRPPGIGDPVRPAGRRELEWDSLGHEHTAGGPIEMAVGSKLERGSAGAASGVSCTSRSLCLASGYFQETQGDASPEAFARRWNGRSWTNAVAGLSRFAWIDGVSCQSSSACVVAGTAYGGPEATSWSKPLVAEWNRGRWSSVSLPLTLAVSGGRWRGGLAGVSCVPSAGCTAVGVQPRGTYDATLAQSDLLATSSLTPVAVVGLGGPASTGGALAAPVLGHTAT
jgi:hypothetical protein